MNNKISETGKGLIIGLIALTLVIGFAGLSISQTNAHTEGQTLSEETRKEKLNGFYEEMTELMKEHGITNSEMMGYCGGHGFVDRDRKHMDTEGETGFRGFGHMMNDDGHMRY